MVLQILGAKPFTSAATDWGKLTESVALQKFQHDSGHYGLYYYQSGFVISEKHPFLQPSLDAVVHVPTDGNPFGLAEIKCPYSFRNQPPFEAAESGLLLSAGDELQWAAVPKTEEVACLFLPSSRSDGHHRTKLV